MQLIVLVLLLTIATPVTTQSEYTTNCYYGGSEAEYYRGTVSTTISGRTCQKWTDQFPHVHDRTPENRPGSGLGQHNNCRNSDGYGAPWCYTTDPATRWEECDVRKCGECPADYPYAFNGGDACCGDSTEMVYAPMGSYCDGSLIGIHSKCCKNNNNVACIGSPCRNFEGGECPSNFPYAFHGGGGCCAEVTEMVYAPMGESCDGSLIGLDSTCCNNNNQLNCPHPPCTNAVGGSCPVNYPNPYFGGAYCCGSDYEKIYAPQGEYCDGSVIGLNSLCCNNDDNILCSNPPCWRYEPVYDTWEIDLRVDG